VTAEADNILKALQAASPRSAIVTEIPEKITGHLWKLYETNGNNIPMPELTKYYEFQLYKIIEHFASETIRLNRRLKTMKMEKEMDRPESYFELAKTLKRYAIQI